MAISYNKKTVGLYTNGCAELGTNTNFSSYTLYREDSLSGQYCFGMLSTSSWTNVNYFSSEYVPVDTSKKYQAAASVKTLQLSYNNRLGSGHIGFACYDKNQYAIDLRNCGGSGNTVLTRDLNVGDTHVYIESTSGWYSDFGLIWTVNPLGGITYKAAFRYFILYPATHPDYSTPYQYTRIGYDTKVTPSVNLCYKSWTQISPTEWELKIGDSKDNDAVMPSIPGVTFPIPAGTPVANGRAGSTYNYCLNGGVPGTEDYPTTWKTYYTGLITGEGLSSGTTFRWATKYIRFLNLANYAYLYERSGPSALYLIDNIIFVECKNGKPYDKSFFSRTDLS